MHNLLPHQHNKTQAYYRSCASAKLKDEAGSKNLATSIWAIRLPPLPWGFPVQQHRRLSEGELQAISWAFNSVLNWLDLLAITLTHYHTTDQYQDAVRKAGNARGESGLTAAEQETRNAIRKMRKTYRGNGRTARCSYLGKRLSSVLTGMVRCINAWKKLHAELLQSIATKRCDMALPREYTTNKKRNIKMNNINHINIGSQPTRLDSPRLA